jgi:hypothetical protein
MLVSVMNVATAVDAWVHGARDELTRHGFAQVDLDDLLGDEPADAARVGMECLGRALDALPVDTDADAMMTLPLEPAGRWPGGVPELDDLLSQAWTYGPGRAVPGLYLVSFSHWRGIGPFEEYRCPLSGGGLPAGFVAYYRAWRQVGDSEFHRCVSIRPCTG